MNKELFLEIFDLYYQITNRKSDLNKPDITIELSSIGWHITFLIFKDGFIKGAKPDKYFSVYEDSSTTEIQEIISELKKFI
jgi:hypothetical protein